MTDDTSPPTARPACPIARGERDFWNGRQLDNPPTEYDGDQQRAWQAGWYFGSEKYHHELSA